MSRARIPALVSSGACPYCNQELPEIQRIYDACKGKGLTVVLINILPEEVKLIPGWMATKHLTMPILIGGSQDALQREYRVEATPTSYLPGDKGQVLYYKQGYRAGDEQELEGRIAAAVNVAQTARLRDRGGDVCAE